MTQNDIYMRLFFLGVCTLLITLYTLTHFDSDNTLYGTIVGVLGGFAFGCCAIGIESLCKQLKIGTFNLITAGLFLGFLMGQVLTLLLDTLLPAAHAPEFAGILGAAKVCIYMLTTYLGMATMLRSTDVLAKFLPATQAETAAPKPKALLMDLSALHDTRIIDLATTGIVDTHLVVPQFLVQLCSDMLDSVDDTLRIKGKRCIDNLRKLEAMPKLELRFASEESAEAREQNQKLMFLARHYNANILTGEGSRLQKTCVEGAKTISLNDLASSLKPLANSGEFLTIKIQRFGKEPHQGIGYLDDGTMVVVNGGADFLGEMIKTQVLSVKHTTSGRIIFCNTLQNGATGEACAERMECETSASSYFAL